MEIVPCVNQGLPFVNRDALDPFQREHAAAGAFPIDGRDTEPEVSCKILS